MNEQKDLSIGVHNTEIGEIEVIESPSELCFIEDEGEYIDCVFFYDLKSNCNLFTCQSKSRIDKKNVIFTRK